MSQQLVTVEQAAQELSLHPKTVLRYIRDNRLPATRVGRSYRILRSELDAFAGIASGRAETGDSAQTTSITRSRMSPPKPPSGWRHSFNQPP